MRYLSLFSESGMRVSMAIEFPVPFLLLGDFNCLNPIFILTARLDPLLAAFAARCTRNFLFFVLPSLIILQILLIV
jgi:hypothetical protein